MKRMLVLLASAAVLLYGLLCAALYAGQRALLYYPTPETHSPLAEALRVETADASLKVWHLARGAEDAVLYFGGNAEDVAWNIDLFRNLLADRDVYLVNYRGYGGSSGTPSEAALLADAEAVFDFVRSRHATVAVIGRSLGSGVAVHLATVRTVRKLALVTPYDSVANVARTHFAVFPVALLIKDSFDSYSKASRIDVPTLVLTAEHDRVIPRASSDYLVTAFAPHLIEATTIRGASHDSISDSQEYRDALRAFLRCDESG